jgi:hypothetical protein
MTCGQVRLLGFRRVFNFLAFNLRDDRLSQTPFAYSMKFTGLARRHGQKLAFQTFRSKRCVSCKIRRITLWGLVARHSSMTAEELIRACAEGNDGTAWEEFVYRFQKPISLSIKRTACQWGKDPAQFVDDLLQETYLKLCADKCRLLHDFSRQHSAEAVLGYVKTIAINVTHDHFKSLHSQKRGGAAPELCGWLQPRAGLPYFLVLLSARYER